MTRARSLAAIGLAAACAVALLASPRRAAADETVAESIARIDAALAAAPGDPALLRRRAALERARGQHAAARADLDRARGHLAAARADLDRAAANGLEPVLVAHDCGLVAMADGRFAEAEAALRRARAGGLEDAATVAAHARALAATGRLREAAQTFSRALELAPHAGPELHLERVRALASGGAAGRAEALRAVDEARERLGAVPALDEAAIELELADGRTDAALARLDGMAASQPVATHLLVRRGEILERAGRPDAALAAYGAALASLDALPPARRAAPALHAIESTARSAVARLAVPDGERSR